MSLLQDILERTDWDQLTPSQQQDRLKKMKKAADRGDELGVADAIAGREPGSFKKFASKTRRRGDSQASEKPEYKAQTNIWDKIKSGAGRVKAAANKDMVPRRDRDYERVAKRSAKAQASIDAENPGMVQRREERGKAAGEKLQRITSRSMKKDEYKSELSKFRAKAAAGDTRTQQLTPLHQNDESKVRQLARRLNAEQAQQLGDAIGAIIKGAQSANT